MEIENLIGKTIKSVEEVKLSEFSDRKTDSFVVKFTDNTDCIISSCGDGNNYIWIDDVKNQTIL